jgi:hypothetical protein
VAALREGGASPLRSADLPELALGGLNLTGTAELLRSADSASGVSERAAWVHRTTGGNPLAIVEIAREPAGLAVVAGAFGGGVLDSMRFRFPRRWPTGSSGARGRSRRRRRRCWPSSTLIC